MLNRYFLNFVEEGIMNPRWYGYVAGRVEVTDEQSESGFSMCEYRFFTDKVKTFMFFRNAFDFKYVCYPVLMLVKLLCKKVFMRRLHK